MPPSTETAACLCDAYCQSRQWPEAIELAKQHLGCSDYFSTLHVAKLLSNAKQYAQAENWLDRHARENGIDIPCIELKSKLRHFQGDYAGAVRLGDDLIQSKMQALGTQPNPLLTGGSKKIAAFSLFGDKPIYCQGAVINALQWRERMPDWQARFYLSRDVPETYRDQLISAGAETVLHSGAAIPHYFSRFRVLEDPTCERFVCRDADCRLSDPEIALIREWEDSDYDYHILRNSPLHTDLILAGMWGGRPMANFDLAQEVTAFFGNRPSNKYGYDQTFLEFKVWSRIASSLLIHDAHFANAGLECRKLPHNPDLIMGHQDEKSVNAEYQKARA